MSWLRRSGAGCRKPSMPKINEADELEKDIEEEDFNDSSGDEVDDEATEEEQETKKASHPSQKIYGYLETYISQVPVLGFNSARYDLGLVKRVLVKHLNIPEDSSAFVIKKNNGTRASPQSPSSSWT